MLVILFGCIRFHEYIYVWSPKYQCESRSQTPRSHTKETITPGLTRLQHMIIVMQKYSITVEHWPGKELAIADTLSKAFLPRTYEDPIYEEIDIKFLHNMLISENKIEQLKNKTHLDHELKQLLQTIKADWPLN